VRYVDVVDPHPHRMIRPLQICSRHLAGTVFVVIGNPVFEIDHDRVRRRAAGAHAGGGREDPATTARPAAAMPTINVECGHTKASCTQSFWG